MARRAGMGQPVAMTKSSKHSWVDRLPAGEPMKASLGRLVEQDGARDQAEVEYYEVAADPSVDSIETAQRRYRSQFRRRLRHRQSRADAQKDDG
jgi:hypothetical protein